jgi:hypothetical protein
MRSEVAELDHPPFDSDQDWYRLIPSRFPPVDVYERLPPAARMAAPEVEALTNPRLASKVRLTGGAAGVDENSPRLQNWNHAPFAYENPEGSYLLSPLYRVMELAGSVEAALAIAICRREGFLGRTGEPPMDLDMRLLLTPVRGQFTDLRHLACDTAQEARWAIGAQLVEGGKFGAVFLRAERPDTQFLAVFDSAPVGRSVQGRHYRFVWDGAVIKSVYDFSTGETMLRGDLLRGSDGREAGAAAAADSRGARF